MMQLNAQNGQKLTLVRIVAFLVTICVSVQLYNSSTFVNSFSFELPSCLTDLWQSEPNEPVKPAEPSEPVKPAKPSEPMGNPYIPTNPPNNST